MTRESSRILLSDLWSIIPVLKLWILYRPGTIMHSKIRGYDRAFKLESYHTVSFGMDVGFHAIGNYIDYVSKNFGKRTQKLKIPPFAGSRTISTLPFAPLEMRMREAEIREGVVNGSNP
jgi:hypothetical protein